MFVYHSCFLPHPFPLSTWPKAHHAVSSHHRVSQQLPCASLALIIVVHPSDRRVHPSHTSLSGMVKAAKIQMKARMDHHVGRHANMMGSLGMSRWEADMLLALTR